MFGIMVDRTKSQCRHNFIKLTVISNKHISDIIDARGKKWLLLDYNAFA